MSATFNTEDLTDNTISREEALPQIAQKAKDSGIKGPFKVYYNGAQVPTTEDLPERVDMSKVRVSAVADQA